MTGQEVVNFGGTDGGATHVIGEHFHAGELAAKALHACVVGQAERVREGREAFVSVVLTEQNSVFGTRSEHAVRLVDALTD